MSKQKQKDNLYFWGDSMNNLSSYCGLTDSKMRASDKDLLHVLKYSQNLELMLCFNFQFPGFSVFCIQFLSSQKKVARLETITFRKVRIKLNAAILSCQKASKLIFFFLHQKFKLCKNLICYSLQRHRNIFKPKNITFYKKSSIDLPNFLQFTLLFSLSCHLSLSVHRVLRSYIRSLRH